MSRPEFEKHEISLIYCHDTEKGVQVHDGIERNGRFRKEWLPKSQIKCETAYHDMEPGKAYSFTLPQWLLLEKGFDLDAQEDSNS